VLVWRGLAHSPGFQALAAALERHVSPEAAAVMRAPFVFGDSTDELRGLLVQAGFRTVRVASDVRMVRFASPAALVRYQVAGSPLAPPLPSRGAELPSAPRRSGLHYGRSHRALRVAQDGRRGPQWLHALSAPAALIFIAVGAALAGYASWLGGP
jgi:hypothetical protein